MDLARGGWRRGVLLVWAVAGLGLGGTGETRGAYQTVVDHGPAANRVKIVFLGDGYTASELTTTYTTHINSLVNYLFPTGGGSTTLVDPYPRYRNFFNAYRVDVASAQSGADDPSVGLYVNTALDASYRWDGSTQRLLYISDSKANAALNAGLGGAFVPNMKFVTVNATQYGGGGGTYAVYSGGNTSAREVALHEVAHSFNKLADEYGGNTGTYGGSEPTAVNLTKDATGAKWSEWLGYNQPGIGTIGAYEGGGYYDHGVYRPSQNSKMRSLNQPFDAVGREKIILDIYRTVDPVDSYMPNAGVLSNPGALWLDVIDPAVINVEWYFDSVLVPGATGERLDLSTIHWTAGQHTVRAHAYDPTDWVRGDRSLLEQNISWTVQLVPEPASLGLAAGGVLVLLARRRRVG